MYFFVTTTPPKPLDIAVLNFAEAMLHMLHDVEGTGQHFM